MGPVEAAGRQTGESKKSKEKPKHEGRDWSGRAASGEKHQQAGGEHRQRGQARAICVARCVCKHDGAWATDSVALHDHEDQCGKRANEGL